MSTSPERRSRQWTVRLPGDLGRVIAGARAERGLTQDQLAEETGVDRTYLARLEAGGTTLAVERALRMLRRMGATITVELEVTDDGPG
jgi:transcriptional regulator with XRE-family HTH domain